MAATSDPTALRLDARDIPIPGHISEAAQQFLAEATARPRGAMPGDGNPAAWKAVAEAWEARLLPQIEPLVAGLPVDMECRRVGLCDVHVATPHGMAGPAAGYAFLDMHGGAFVFGGGRFCQLITKARAMAVGCRVFGVDYRMPPGHPYPAALDDCVGVYRYLLEHYDAAHIVVGGLSAGGNLAAATVLRARDEGLALPAAAVLLTPELDLTESGDSFATNRTIDVALPDPLPEANALYAGGADLSQPYLSPLFADLSAGYPPIFLQTGTRDLFLSNTVRMHRKLIAAGIETELHVWEAMPHAGFGGGSPEDFEVSQAVRAFLIRSAGWVL
jgi:monoterpene epsilon-lactone hydrolase